MPRIVTAIYSTRAEAESARLRLGAAAKVQSAQVLARETAAALDNLGVHRDDAQACRDALQAGDHVLVATVARGELAAPIVDALTVAGDVENTDEDGPRLSYDIGAVEPARPAAKIARPAALNAPRAGKEGGIAGIVTASREATTLPPRTPAAEPTPAVKQSAPPAEEVQPPAPPKETPEIRIGQPRAAYSAASNPQASGRGDFESRAPARRLSEAEVEAGGLLKNRVIEVVEMREEPVISKEVVVREEVIIRKTVDERIETIDDTVRRTEVEVEELP